MSEFGQYVKSLRVKRNWTLREAAQRAGLSHNRLGEIERGASYRTERRTRPSRSVVEGLARAYEVPKDTLLAMAGYPVGELAELSADAREAVHMFETLPAHKRRLVLGILRVFISEGDPL